MRISQRDYIIQTLEHFDMTNANYKKSPIPDGAVLYQSIGKPLDNPTEYMSIVGRLIYLSIHTRTDIGFIVSRLCQFTKNPTDYHLALDKRVLRYLIFTKDYSLVFRFKAEKLSIVVHCDADFANDIEGKSINGICVQLYGSLVSWTSRKQSNVSLHTCESEITSITEGISELIYFSELLKELSEEEADAVLFNDNQSAVTTCANGGDFNRNKYFRFKINFIQDVIEKGWLKIKHWRNHDSCFFNQTGVI